MSARGVLLSEVEDKTTNSLVHVAHTALPSFWLLLPDFHPLLAGRMSFYHKDV